MIIKCSKDSSELEFSEREGLSRTDGSEYFLVTIRGHNLTAFSKVYAFDPFDNGLTRFFEDIAKSWKGWNGEKKWISLEGELSLVCTADLLGHVAIEATLFYGFDGWSVRNVFYIDAGQLEQLASDIKKFFAV